MKTFLLELWLRRNSGLRSSRKAEELHSSLGFLTQTVATKAEGELLPLNGQRAERGGTAALEKWGREAEHCHLTSKFQNL